MSVVARAALMIVCGLAATTSPAIGQAVAPPREWTAVPCSADIVTRTSVTDIKTSPNAFLGQCVKVRGVLWDFHLYEEAAFTGSVENPSIRADPPKTFRWSSPAVVTITGRVVDCAAIADAIRGELATQSVAPAGAISHISIYGACTAEHGLAVMGETLRLHAGWGRHS